MKFTILYSEKAKEDIFNLSNYITVTCKAPETSKKYMKELFHKINSLSHSADSYSLYNKKSYSQYGFNVRRINFKKMAIIYTVHENIVLIQRIVAGKIIIEAE